MGKISEALKKAGKEERLRPLEEPQKHLPPEVTNVAPKNTQRPNQSKRKVSTDATAPTAVPAAAPVERPVVLEVPMPDRHPDPAPSTPDGDADRGTQESAEMSLSQRIGPPMPVHRTQWLTSWRNHPRPMNLSPR